MRYFSTSSATITTVRKNGYYPSMRVSLRLAGQLVHLLELVSSDVQYVADFLNGKFYRVSPETLDCISALDKCYSLTSSERAVIEELRAWWVADEDEPALLAQKAFFAVNLNRGYTLCIVSKL